MKIGFLGAGAMGGAIINGILNAGIINAEDVHIYDTSEKICATHAARGCKICISSSELCKDVDMIVVAVKPQYASSALNGLEMSIEGKAVVSVMAGITTTRIREMIKSNIRVLRTMPNAPAFVSAGAFVLCDDTDFSCEERIFIEHLFNSIGTVEWMNENLIDTACGLSGSGPAFVALFIEALADGGVLEGLPRLTAYHLAMQTVYGSAKMLLETDMHPGQLKDMVSSPAGTTIIGCQVLEERGFRAAAINAVQAATRRSREF